jgi:hypothetical protein
MPLLLIARDRDGYEIRVFDDRWFGHILLRHAELTNHLAWIGETINAPEGVAESAWEPDSRVYYRQYPFDPPLGMAFLRVVIRYNRDLGTGRLRGNVVTAYPQAQALKKGETRLWP